jgi:hypothetical protein
MRRPPPSNFIRWRHKSSFAYCICLTRSPYCDTRNSSIPNPPFPVRDGGLYVCTIRNFPGFERHPEKRATCQVRLFGSPQTRLYLQYGRPHEHEFFRRKYIGAMRAVHLERPSSALGSPIFLKAIGRAASLFCSRFASGILSVVRGGSCGQRPTCWQDGGERWSSEQSFALDGIGG